MSPPIPTTISRSSLTLRECPPELAAELAYVRQAIAFEAGSFKSTPVKVSYAHYDPRTQVCRSYPNALHLIKKAAEQLGLQLNVADHRIWPALNLSLLNKAEYSADCFRALEAVTRANSSGLIVVTAGTEKTSIVCGLVRMLPQHFKVLVTTEDKAVVNQIHAALAMVLPNERVGIHNKPISNPARIIVANLDALKDFTQGELAYSGYALRDFDAWICDEVHRLPEPSRVPLLNQFRTVFCWGLTATPDRADNSHQINSVIFGPILFQARHNEAPEVQQRSGEKGIVKALVFPLPAEWPIPEDWLLHAAIRAAYLKNPKLALLLKGIDAALPESSKVVIFADTIRLGILLRKALPRYPFLHGRLPENVRQKELDRFKSGDINRIILADICSDGIELPELDYLVDCSVQLAPNLIIQRAGCAARRTEIKPTGHYIVFLCLASEHLFNHGIRKLQSIDKIGWDVRYMFPRSVTDALPFEQTPLLSELGTFIED